MNFFINTSFSAIAVLCYLLSISCTFSSDGEKSYPTEPTRKNSGTKQLQTSIRHLSNLELVPKEIHGSIGQLLGRNDALNFLMSCKTIGICSDLVFKGRRLFIVTEELYKENTDIIRKINILFKGLHGLELVNIPSMTDTDFGHIGCLTSLECLHLEGLPIETDLISGTLSSLTHLQELILDSLPNVTNLAALVGRLSSLKKLKLLDLGDMKITHDVLHQIIMLNNIRILKIFFIGSEPEIGDFSELSKMANLESIVLDAAVTFDPENKMENLKDIVLPRGQSISSEWFEEFIKKAPNIKSINILGSNSDDDPITSKNIMLLPHDIILEVPGANEQDGWEDVTEALRGRKYSSDVFLDLSGGSVASVVEDRHETEGSVASVEDGKNFV